MEKSEELRSRVLAELYEAGEENVPTLLNTIYDHAGQDGSLKKLTQALLELLDSGLIEVAKQKSSLREWQPLPMSEAVIEIKSVPSELTYDIVAQTWRSTKRGCEASVLLTVEGRKRSEALLSVRGYRWWRAM